MIQNEALDMIIDSLLDRKLGEAITATENFLAVHPGISGVGRDDGAGERDRLFAIRTDYQLMTDYWRRGYKDPKLPELYDNLLRRMYGLYANIAGSYAVRHTPFLESLHNRARMTARDWSPQVVRESLEAFVSEVALSGLEERGAKNDFGSAVARWRGGTKTLYERHHREMVELFDYILTAGMWTDGYAAAMEETLLSPTVDTNDQQLILSAVMLATMNVFDMAKFRTMVDVYRRATDEHVRQRALIGWALSMDSDVCLSLFPEAIQLVDKLLEDETCCQELVALQKQLIFCIDAERDHRTIQDEIMPDLINNQGFRITRNGIEEEPEDELNDILHPDAEEEKIERVEQSFQKMMAMQKQGSDIYFGGFSRMKGFPFFNEMANWFVPYYPEHPDVSTAVGKFGNNSFLNSVLRSGPFCNSDKYSFLLAFEQVVSRIPENLRELMEQSETVVNEMPREELESPEYIRRICLQDLYRFFRLFPQREAFRNVFDQQEGRDYMILASAVYRSTQVETYFNEVTAFLIKRNRQTEAHYILNNYSENRQDFQYYMMAAHTGLDRKGNYAKALALQPDNERALAGYARALFNSGDYEQALDVYDRLLRQQPDKKSYLLNKAVCLTTLERYEESEKVLFRLNYEHADDMNVNRVLAWTLTGDGKYDQADKLYRQLLSDELQPEDLLNYGYCLWFSGHVDEAADCFHRYLKESGEKKESIIENERWLIHEKGITEPEMQMMLYILNEE